MYSQSDMEISDTDTPAACDHTSVGVLVFRDNALLLINRRRPPFGLAAPAGHVDVPSPTEEDFQAAAIRELQKEMGLTAMSLTFLGGGRRENHCRRPDGNWHEWRIYEAVVTGTVEPSTAETKGWCWCGHDELAQLLQGEALRVGEEDIGLEPVWREWLEELAVLPRLSV